VTQGDLPPSDVEPRLGAEAVVAAEADPGASASTPPPSRQLALGASAGFVAQVIGLGFTALASVVLAHVVGPAGTGIYSLLSNVATALGLIVAIGLPTGMMLELNRRGWSYPAALRATSFAALAMGAVGAPIGLAAYMLTRNGLFHGVSLLEITLALVSVPFTIAATFTAVIAMARQMYERYALIQIAGPALTLIAVVALIFPFGIKGAVAGYLLGQVGGAVVGLGLVGARARREPRVGETVTRERHLASAVAQGARSWGADMLQFLNYRLDLFIVAAYASKASVGQYSIAISLTTLGWMLPNSIAQTLVARVAALDRRVRLGEVSDDTALATSNRVLRHSVLLQVPTAIGLVMLLTIGVPLIFGASFGPSVDLGLLLIPGVVALGVGKVTSAVIVGRGYPIYGTYVTLVMAPLTIAMYFLLIPKLGATGGAIASSASYTGSTLIGIFLLKRVTQASLREALIPKRTDLADYTVRLSAARQAVRSRFSRPRGGERQ
jgi:O-antigen/teichoic acid export membrane protein